MSEQLQGALRDIADDIRARPGRAGLAFLALGVGMTALTVLLAVLGGLEARAKRIVEELGAQVAHARTSARARALACAAAPKAAKSAREKSCCRTANSGCHWTPIAKLRPSTRTASICPSGASASTTRPGAGRSIPCA